MSQFKRFRLLVLLSLLLICPQDLRGQLADLVADINEDTRGAPATRMVAAVGDRLLYATTEGMWSSEGVDYRSDFLFETDFTQPEVVFEWKSPVSPGVFLHYQSALWFTDGTLEGTERLTAADEDVSLPLPKYRGTADFGDFVLFTAHSFRSGSELWRSDGTAEGTYQVQDLYPQGSASPSSFAVFGDELFFKARGPCEDRFRDSLWRTDGSAGNIEQVHCDTQDEVQSVVALSDKIVFTDSRSLRASLGNSGDAQVLMFSGSRLGSLSVVNDHAYFLVDSSSVWRTDGTVAGTVEVLRLPFGYLTRKPPIALPSGAVLVIAQDGLGQGTLWRSRGRPETTREIGALCGDRCAGLSIPGPGTTATGQRLVSGERYYFYAEDPLFGEELWVTDGTGAGTIRLTDVCPGSCDALIGSLQEIDGTVYFLARQDEQGYDIWSTDGTRAGTQPLTRFLSAGYVSPTAPAVVPNGQRLYFVASSSSRGSGIWSIKRSGGPPRLDARAPDRGDDSIVQGPWSTAGGPVVLVCEPGIGPRPFDTDLSLYAGFGTGSATRLERIPSTDCDDLRRLDIVDIGDHLAYEGVFAGLKITDGTSLFPLDLDPLGIDFLLFSDSGSAVREGRLYFWGIRDGLLDLLRTDGTQAGTERILTLPDGLESVGRMTLRGDLLLFVVRAPDDSLALWSTDLSEEGTRQVVDFEDPSPFSGPAPLYSDGGEFTLFFIENDDANAFHLWRTDGTPNGTGPVVTLPRSSEISQPVWLDGQAYFMISTRNLDTGDYQRSIWASDGTPAGTMQVVELFETDGPSLPREPLRSLGGQLYFQGFSRETGWEPWVSDGSAAGTFMLSDLATGSASSYPEDWTLVGERIFFTAWTLAHGRELRVIDRPGAAPRLLHDIHPGAGASSPENLTVDGDTLYFSADDGATGRELWALPLSGDGACVPTDHALCLQDGRYRVEMRWRDFRDRRGRGRVEELTPDTGYFWFFDSENVETVVKIHDGQLYNGHDWVFYGALSNVEYHLTVSDAATGLTRRYFNPLENFASVGDNRAFGPQGASLSGYLPFDLPAASSAPATPVTRYRTAPDKDGCVAGENRLCLLDNRFAVEIEWHDFQGDEGVGVAVPLTDQTGYFWFYRDSNVETVVKVFDGRTLNGKFWVFYGALTNVGYTLRVIDTVTGIVNEYENRLGNFTSVGDTGAF